MPTTPTIMPFDADMVEPIVESYGYLTEVLAGANGTEQRRQLRAVPQRTQDYTVTLINEAEVARFRALMHRGQGLRWYVPLWQYSRRTTLDTNNNQASVWVDWRDLPYRSGGYVAVWNGYTHCVVATCGSFGSVGSAAADQYILLSGPPYFVSPGYSFPTDISVAMPCEIGLLAEKSPMTPIGRDAWQARLSFVFESMVA